MLEQTGYEVQKFIQLPMPTIYCDPWKSNESGLLYIAMINGDDPNAKKEQNLEEQQNIKVIKVPFDDKLMYTISDLVKNNDYALQSKLWSVCLGLTMSKYIKK